MFAGGVGLKKLLLAYAKLEAASGNGAAADEQPEVSE